MQELIDGSLVHERADQCAVLHRVADAGHDLLVRAGDAVDERIGDLLVDDQPPRAGAALPRGADGAEDNGPQREFLVGIFVDDDRVVAAKLEQRASEPARHNLAHAPAHAARARSADQRQAAVGDHPLADHFIRPHDQPKDAGVTHRRGDPVGDGVGRDAGQRREKAWLPDDHIAADGREHGVPRPNGVGEVERGDDADGAQRQPLLKHPVAGSFAGERRTVELPGKTHGKIGDVHRLLHLADTLGLDLAHLGADQGAQGFAVAPELLPDSADHLAADRGGDLTPRLERLNGLCNGAFVRLRGVEPDTAERLKGGGTHRCDDT